MLRTGITADSALRLAKALGTTAQLWLNLQTDSDIQIAKRDLGDALDRIKTINKPGAAFFHHADNFAMVRGGHLDVAILGAYEVAENGDLANWSTGPKGVPAVGGAMDPVWRKARRGQDTHAGSFQSAVRQADVRRERTEPT
jgi:hypothetical protein